MAEQDTAEPGTSAKTTTKATLIDVGTRLILEQGYHQTGIQDVLQAAGVPKGSFYDSIAKIPGCFHPARASCKVWRVW